jgi:hypothetical protein
MCTESSLLSLRPNDGPSRGTLTGGVDAAADRSERLLETNCLSTSLDESQQFRLAKNVPRSIKSKLSVSKMTVKNVSGASKPNTIEGNLLESFQNVGSNFL